MNQPTPPNEHAAAGADHGQPFEIIINAESFDIKQKQLTFRELCLLAFPDGQFGENVAWTVTYSDPHGPEGSMVDGDTIKVKKGMVFNVGRSDKS
ncbi:multiubiquitin domain-containing protein [Janthinobacterium lividum]|uniref:multiubiquitin domain-containing protein n=1 Tax=Janthinobacterium lividum TaxID=29581 RepID=UPI000892E0F9|nr:multiubiquitin domain-containing protein [Janthinobacterium lividum]MCC7714666.1 multiubiquitin domain-containing protein [Janthinobacterium lividum]OEZ56081.1 hypothetical protein JANLI_30370 [Janthinobacterium lividum]WQE30134.1 multiubiquitin domain-containing protein [Janthinobacterium lividum]STQ95632.1 Uncharacterised protein [Janthinobacterium lividum]